MQGERGRIFKEIYGGVYPKGPNSWIHSTDFKHLFLTLIFVVTGEKESIFNNGYIRFVVKILWTNISPA